MGVRERGLMVSWRMCMVLGRGGGKLRLGLGRRLSGKGTFFDHLGRCVFPNLPVALLAWFLLLFSLRYLMLFCPISATPFSLPRPLSVPPYLSFSLIRIINRNGVSPFWSVIYSF